MMTTTNEAHDRRSEPGTVDGTPRSSGIPEGFGVGGRRRRSVAALLFAAVVLASCARSPSSAVAPLGRTPRAYSAFVAYVESSDVVESLVFPIFAGLATPRFDPVGVRVVPGLLAEVPVSSPASGSDRVAVAVNTGTLATPTAKQLEALWAFRCRGLSNPADSCTITTNTEVTIETRFATTVVPGIATVGEQRMWVGGRIGERERPCACVHLPYLDHEIFLAEGLDDEWELDSLREFLGDGAQASAAGGEDGEGEDDGKGSAEDEACDERCDNDACTFVTLASILGGTVQALEEYENIECGDRQITADVEWWAMSTSPPADLPSWARRVRFVESLRIDGDGAEVPWQVPIGRLSAGVDDGDSGDNDTDPYAAPCEPLDGDIYSLHRGLLVRSTVGLDQWVSCARHEVAPATPTSCPTADDPCGDPALFPPLATADAATDFWVASDGTAALVWSTPPRVLTRSPESQVSSGGDPIEVAVAFPAPRSPGSPGGKRSRGTVVGVQYYADAGPIQAALAASVSEADRAFEWFPWPLTFGARAAVSGPGRPPTDAAGVVDRGDGKGWGNRCFSEFKADRHQAAFDACEYALTFAVSPPTRAAVLHSLGLIADRVGNEQDAIAYFRTSLELRDHDATRGALRAALAEIVK